MKGLDLCNRKMTSIWYMCVQIGNIEKEINVNHVYEMKSVLSSVR